jgi:hypothetical protein
VCSSAIAIPIKGFKCLDPSEGRVYISRDVVFDETVFPFASLHPNAGARLRAELELLPDILLNPSTNFGDALIHDQHLISPKPTDACSSSSTCTQPAGTNSDSNGDQIGENMDVECPYFICAFIRGAGHTPKVIFLLSSGRLLRDPLQDRSSCSPVHWRVCPRPLH